ncbi:MAG TPA: DinB family protein [Bryobacteraceae bacterium]|nr:DinB family protein [Bryobacteraceae bacterium]
MRKYIVCGLLAAASLLAQRPSGFRGEFIDQLNATEKKYIQLAEATPQEKYTWRPADGVRSMSEVFMHIVGANYMIPSFLGSKMPADFSRDMEKKVTEKAKVIDWLKKSFENVRQLAMNGKDEDFEKTVKLFGSMTMTQRASYLLIANHMHEHLGQQIAYARMNGVVPPWSAGGRE